MTPSKWLTWQPETPAPLTDRTAKSPPTPPFVSFGGEGVARFESKNAAPDWQAVAAQPGHCGSCARWAPFPDWGRYLGTCGAPFGDWWPGNPPLAIHEAHRCAARAGQAYRLKVAP